jgi:hypothetical protein
MNRLVSFADVHARLLLATLAALFVILGLSIAPHYGVTWDEEMHRYYGMMTYDRVFEGGPGLERPVDKYHGLVIDTILYAAERIARLEDPNPVYLLRHRLLFLLFAVGVICFSVAAGRAYKSRLVGVLGGVFLILSPRILAESFNNPIDLPFLSLMAISFFTLQLFLERKSVPRALLHGFACGLAIDVRLSGVVLPAITLLVLALRAVLDPHERAQRSLLQDFLVFPVATGIAVTAFWPTLWSNPPIEFLQAWRIMSHFPWAGEGVFYLGKSLPGSKLPWHYLPVWIAITTPLLYLALSAIGIAGFVRRVIASPRAALQQHQTELIALLWLILPLAAAIALRPVMYNGWRHFYFVYPALLLLSLAGLRDAHALVSSTAGERARRYAGMLFTGIVVFSLGGTAAFMIRNHPQEYVYFSSSIGGIRGAEGRFELDYWGAGYKQALERLLAEDKRREIRIAVANTPGRINVLSLQRGLRARLIVAEGPEDADYFLTNHYNQHGKYPDKPQYPEAFSVTVDGVPIVTVYRVKAL